MNSKPKQQEKFARQTKNLLQQAQHQDKELKQIKQQLSTTRSGGGVKKKGKKRPSSPVHAQNRVLATLLEPERFQSVRWPDGYHAKTAMVPGMVNEQIPYFSSTTTSEDPGSFNLMIRPSAIHPVWVYGKNAQPVGTYFGFVDEQADYGLFPTSDEVPGVSEECGNMILQSSVEMNLKYPMTFNGVDWVQEPYKALAADGTTFFGQPMSGFTTGANRVVYGRFILDGHGVAVGDTLRVNILDNKGNVVTTNIAATVANQQIFDLGATTVNTLVPVEGDASVGTSSGRPGLGIRLRWTGATGDSMMLTAAHIRYAGTAAAWRHCMYPLDLEDQDMFLRDVDLYRTISQSALLSYMGASLTDGGQIASLTYGGGEHPNELGFWKKSGVAEAVNSPYDGPLKNGTYCVWAPRDSRDMQMRKTVNSDDWKHPYIVIAGIVSSPDILNTLRLKMFANYEVVTKSRFLAQAYGEQSPQQIVSALLHMRSFPKNGPNDTHLQSIRNFLKSAWDTTTKAVSWAYDNKGWIIPAATAVAALL